MAWYPDRHIAPNTLCTKPRTLGEPGSNGKPKRIVIHTTGSTRPESDMTYLAAGSVAWWNKQVADQPGLMVSAHFTIERDGFVVQHVDTDRAAYGTGWLTTESIHIEHAGHGDRYPLTHEQRFASAELIAWLAGVHPDIKLRLTGTSLTDYGTPEDAGITCHRFIQLRAKAVKKMAITEKPCPGRHIIEDLPTLLMLATIVSISGR